MRVVTNLSTKKYWKGQDRLKNTLRTNSPSVKSIMFMDEEDVLAKPHAVSMYGFKPKSFFKLFNMGYTSILWLDASMYVLKDLTPIFEHIEKHGYFWQDSGWSNERWTTEKAKAYFGRNHGTMISSGVLGLDLTNPIALNFLNEWQKASNDGMFNGSHENYRHDQSAASLIIQYMGLEITENNTFWQYGKPEEKPLHENILIVANGIV